MAATSNLHSPTRPPESILAALADRRYFKLICGGSFTETGKIQDIVRAYAQAGADCIDIAPDPDVLSAVENALADFSPETRPVVMISLPLDPDPHFRKIDLTEPDCIRCGLCLPVCPTEALTLPEQLAISQSLCYGCGRCVPVCPTDALQLLPFQVEEQIEALLQHPWVQAVEIHSRHVDPYMLSAFLSRWSSLLQGKLLSLCFRPDGIPDSHLLEFCAVAAQDSALPVMLQIDGAPMSGSSDPKASRPALEAAVQVAELFVRHQHPLPPVTISGGINAHTATLLQEARYQWIGGAGMGTEARKAVWALSEPEALAAATRITAPFQRRHEDPNPLPD